MSLHHFSRRSASRRRSYYIFLWYQFVLNYSNFLSYYFWARSRCRRSSHDCIASLLYVRTFRFSSSARCTRASRLLPSSPSRRSMSRIQLFSCWRWLERRRAFCWDMERLTQFTHAQRPLPWAEVFPSVAVCPKCPTLLCRELREFRRSPNQRTLDIDYKPHSLMKPAKNVLPKKFGPKASAQNQPTPAKSDRAVEGGLARTVQLLEQDVEQLTRVGQLYRRQIEELERDNLALYSRLQEVRAEHEAVLASLEDELACARLHNHELTRIVRLLEEEVRAKGEEIAQAATINEQMTARVKTLEEAAVVTEILKADVQRYKIKLLQSEKYWLTRTETFMGNKDAERERSLHELETNYGFKIKACQDEIDLRDKVISEKTDEIHKLIHYIQTKLS